MAQHNSIASRKVQTQWPHTFSHSHTNGHFFNFIFHMRFKCKINQNAKKQKKNHFLNSIILRTINFYTFLQIIREEIEMKCTIFCSTVCRFFFVYTFFCSVGPFACLILLSTKDILRKKTKRVIKFYKNKQKWIKWL